VALFVAARTTKKKREEGIAAKRRKKHKKKKNYSMGLRVEQPTGPVLCVRLFTIDVNT
jgi:hypothetical protein